MILLLHLIYLYVITYKTNLTKTPAYLSDIIHEYHPACTLQSADKLLLTVGYRECR